MKRREARERDAADAREQAERRRSDLLARLRGGEAPDEQAPDEQAPDEQAPGEQAPDGQAPDEAEPTPPRDRPA